MAKKRAPFPFSLAGFKLYPETSKTRRFHFEVLIYRDRKQMRRVLPACGPAKRGQGGICGLFKPEDGSGHRLGTIYLNRLDCFDDTVAHEILHAACWWAEKMGWTERSTLKGRSHERWVEGYCHMIHQFWMKFLNCHLHSETWRMIKKPRR